VVNDVCDAKAYLRKLELADVHINNKLEDLQKLRTMVTKITSSITPVSVSGSGSQDKLGDTIAKIVDLQSEINDKIDRYVDMKREVNTLIDQLEDPDQVQVIHKRYVEYKPLELIAIEMNCTYRNVCYIHGKALQTVEALLKGGEGNG
jgi:DNA-directed RNA polymerase specialized sigma subunit